MQHSSESSSSSRPRQRTFTSCTECRRRKQRCNQAKDRPCNNCSRRYPPVECTYESSSPPPSHNRTLDFQDRTHHHSHSHTSSSHHQDQQPIGTSYSSHSINPAYTQPSSYSHQNISDPSSYYPVSTYGYYSNPTSSYDQMPTTSSSDFIAYDDGFYSGDSSAGFGMSSAGSAGGGGGYFSTNDSSGAGWNTSHGGDAFAGSNVGGGMNTGEVFYTSYNGQDGRNNRG